jgi:hypothetical protein
MVSDQTYNTRTDVTTANTFDFLRCVFEGITYDGNGGCFSYGYGADVALSLIQCTFKSCNTTNES